jgi:hypothetical protein
MASDASSRLDFIVRFVRADFAAPRPGDLLNWREDLSAFLGIRAGGQANVLLGMAAFATVTSPPFPRDYMAEDFRRLRDAARRLLLDFLSGQTRGQHSFLPVELTVQLSVLSGIPSVPTGLVKLSGSARDVFLMTLAMLLVHDQTASHLRLCPACGEPFLRHRKQRYCTRRCANRALKQSARTDPAVKAKEARAARERYVAQVERMRGMAARRRLEKKRRAWNAPSAESRKKRKSE